MKSVKSLLSPYRGMPREIYVVFFARMINAMGMFIFPLFTLILSKKIGLSPSETGFWLMMMSFVFVPSSILGGKNCRSFWPQKADYPIRRLRRFVIHRLRVYAGWH